MVDFVYGLLLSSFKFLESLRDCYLEQLIQKPTRSRLNQNPSILDLVLTNDINYIQDITYESPLGASDHCVLAIDLTCYTESRTSTSQRLNYYKGDYDALRKHLTREWRSELEDLGCQEAYDWFTTKLEEGVRKCIPVKRQVRKPGQAPLSYKVVQQIKRKHRLWNRYIETRDPLKYREYCKARNKVKKMVLNDRKAREKDIAESAKSNCKNFWKYVNSKRKSKSGISELHVVSEGKTTISSSDTQKADTLASFFSSVFTEEDTSTGFPDLQLKCEETSSNEPFTQDEITKLLQGIDVSKSPGPDQIHPKILKELTHVIDEPLCIIFNKSFKSGRIPESWKVGQISALFKKGNKKAPSNYRPVSLTSVLCKLMEKLIRKKIVDHMDKFNLFSEDQFGFIGGRSTTVQLLKALDNWTSILDQGGHISAVYMDFMKAFDKVPHVRLLNKLRSYNISEQTCDWVRSFLSNRKQRVCVNGQFSAWHDVTSGIPQGSVLGPILFVIFINDMPSCVESDVFLFADDTKIYREIQSDNDSDILQEDLDKLFKWSTDWLLRFHPDKCKVLNISGQRKEANDRVFTMQQYDGGRVDLEVVKQEKDIGVTIDSHLSFEAHIQNQINKANRTVGLIRRSFKYLDKKTFKLLFKALVRPVLEYASSVWSPYKKKHIESIENVQRRATKMLPGFKDLPYTERLQQLDLPTLKFRRLRGDLIETYKILGGSYDPRVTHGLFTLNSNTTRGHSLKLSKARSRLDIRKHFFTQRIVDAWNSLTDKVVTAPSVNSFKNRLDKFMKNQPLKFDYNEQLNYHTGKEHHIDLNIEAQQSLRSEST